jgi:hypothetical protein
MSGPSFRQIFSPGRFPARTRKPPLNTSVVFTDEPVNKHPGGAPFHKLYLLKVFMKKLYTSRASEVTFAALIMGNFVANAAEAQVSIRFSLLFSALWSSVSCRILPLKVWNNLKPHT